MSGCRNCGQHVTWARKGEYEGARWLPPLEVEDRGFVVDFEPTRQGGEPIAREVTIYRIHECKAENIEEYQRRQSEQQQVLSAAENGRLAMHEYAMKRDCEKCGSLTGEVCVNLTQLNKDGTEVPVRYPHPVRMEGFWSTEEARG